MATKKQKREALERVLNGEEYEDDVAILEKDEADWVRAFEARTRTLDFDLHDRDSVQAHINASRAGFHPPESSELTEGKDGEYADWLGRDVVKAQVFWHSDVKQLPAIIVNHSQIRALGERHADTSLWLPAPGSCVLLLRPASAGPAFRLRDQSPNLWWVSAASRLCDILPLLAARRKALRNMGSFTFQTLAGVVNCGTHGSGRELGCIADDVESVDLAAGDGRLVRIERTGGPTDPAQGPPHGWTLIQDDATFHRAVVGLGAFGVAVGYTLRVVDEYFLEEETAITTFEDATSDMDALSRLGRHVELYINPYDRALGNKHGALRIVRTVLPGEPSRSTVIDTTRPKQRLALKRAARVRSAARRFVRGQGVARFRISIALRFLRADDGAIRGPWWEVLRRDSFVCAHGFEVFFPMEVAREGGVELLKTIDRESRFADQDVPLEQCVAATTPVGMRFIKSSPHALAMTSEKYLDQGKEKTTKVWVSFEVGRLLGTPNPEVIPEAICRALTKARIPFRVHWGQFIPATAPLPLDVYPSFADWKNTRATFDPHDKFVTARMRRMGLE